MRLQEVSLQGRRFAIQLGAIATEFGHVIPWLNGTQHLALATNGTYVRDELLRRTRLDEGEVTPYQFVLGDRSREFVGGILTCARSPEQLTDPRNLAIVEELDANHYGFISCLQVHPNRRNNGSGSALMRQVIPVILADRGSVWGVASNPQLLRWYRSLGATTPSPMENRDNLWIVHWTA